MNLKQRHSLLEENNRLRKSHDDLSDKIDTLQDLIIMLRKDIAELKLKETIVYSHEPAIEKKKPIEEQPNVFIPSPSSSGLTTNFTELKKTIRDTDVQTTAKELSKISDGQTTQPNK